MFPGLGAGAHLARANRISDGMLLAASRAVSESLTADDRAHGLVLPDASQLREVGARVAAAVMVAAAEEELAGCALPADPQQFVRDWRYAPRYQRYVPL